jgi:mono/diheme cytochrome c family protein
VTIRRPPLTRAAVLLTIAAGLLAAPQLVAAPAVYPEDVMMGRKVYEQHCQKCHGVDGRGDGPQAQWQYLPPANFHKPSSILKSDQQLISVIEHGVIFSPMHSFRGTLNATEVQDVVAYIRLLSQRGR